MTWLAGVDGCRRGWFRVCRETTTGELVHHVLERAADLWQVEPRPRVIAIDMPIGLPTSGARECDRAARALLGPRRSSVFPAPVRAAIDAADREEASRRTAAIDGRRVGAQAWGIYPKIRELDTALRAGGDSDFRIHEVHPELSFCAWNGGVPMAFAKRSEAGRRARRLLVTGWLGDPMIKAARESHRRKDLADDDILDAVATLWTAHRIFSGEAVRIPEDPPVDETGLAMEIVY